MSQTSNTAPDRILVDAERVRHWDNPNGIVVDASCASNRSKVDVEYVRSDCPMGARVASQKLLTLQEQGWEVSGVSVSKQTEDGSWRHGFVTDGGLVGWHQANAQNGAKVLESLRLARDLICEAKGVEGPNGGSVTDHLDAAENWLDEVEAYLLPSPLPLQYLKEMEE